MSGNIAYYRSSERKENPEWNQFRLTLWKRALHDIVYGMQNDQTFTPRDPARKDARRLLKASTAIYRFKS